MKELDHFLPNLQKQDFLEDLYLQVEIEKISKNPKLTEKEKLAAVAKLVREKNIRDFLKRYILY